MSTSVKKSVLTFDHTITYVWHGQHLFYYFNCSHVDQCFGGAVDSCRRVDICEGCQVAADVRAREGGMQIKKGKGYNRACDACHLCLCALFLLLFSSSPKARFASKSTRWRWSTELTRVNTVRPLTCPQRSSRSCPLSILQHILNTRCRFHDRQFGT